VDVAMLPSLARHDDIAALTNGYGQVIVDECHHLAAAAYDHSVKRIGAQFWLGLTATPTRRDGLGQIVTWQLGPVRHTMTDEIQGTLAAAQETDAGPRRRLFIHETEFHSPDVDLSSPGALAAVHRSLIADEQRNAQIVADLTAALGRGRNCLVLTRRVAHVDILASLLAPRGHEALVLRGGMSTANRRAVVNKLADTKAGDGVLVIGTTPFIGEGFDAPALDTLFLAAPISFDEWYAPHPAKTSPKYTTTTTRRPRSSPPHYNAACRDTGHSASARRNRRGSGQIAEEISTDRDLQLIWLAAYQPDRLGYEAWRLVERIVAVSARNARTALIGTTC